MKVEIHILHSLLVKENLPLVLSILDKESLIKCMSSNLNDIRKINGLPLEGCRSINGEDYYTRSMIYEGYSLSVTLHTKEDFEIVINRIDSLEEFN